MSQLRSFRRQLQLLRLSRLAVRWWAAVAGGLALLLVVLLLLFATDVLVLEPAFRLRVVPRLLALAVGAALVGWLGIRFLVPCIRQRESTLETALLVERQFGINSDLVAALQFESPRATRWGSVELEQAVIEQAAQQSDRLNVFAGFPWRRPLAVGGLLFAACFPWIVGWLLLPTHVSVFANRLCLGTRHYPTRTQLESLTINDQRVLAADEDGMSPRAFTVAQGRPLRFRVHARGQLPTTGRVRLTAAGGRRQRDVELRRVGTAERADELQSEKAAKGAVYEGRWNRLVEDVSFQVELGDAWTDPGKVRMTPLPLVELQWTIDPPDYARNAFRDESAEDSRQLIVPEGSRVNLAVRSAGGKRLTQVWLELTRSGNPQRVHLLAADNEGLRWRLPDQPTALRAIDGDLRFELQVLDSDGLQLESPVRGSIRIRRDRPPSATADLVHRVVLPTAQPVVEYRLLDDYAVAQAQLRLQVQRNPERDANSEDASEPPDAVRAAGDPVRAAGEETVSQRSAADRLQSLPDASAAIEETRLPLVLGSLPVTGARLPLSGRQAITLESLGLRKGDRLKISLEVTDYRGERSGETYLADPLYLEIADAGAVLEEISKADERSEERLTEILKRQLGIGDAP